MDGLMAMKHSEILELFNDAWEADRDNRDQAYEDLQFVAGDQWHPQAKAEREAYRRPVITINRLPQFVRQVTGDMRLNPVSINVAPVDDETDIQKAEIFEGIIRQIEHGSGATNVYAHAFECQAGVGIGHFRISTQYAPDTVDDQEIRIQRIFNPLAVVWDPGSVEIDRSDANYCFVTDLMPERLFKRKYPKATLESFSRDDAFNTGMYWKEGEFVRVAEFWHREPYERTLAITEEGETLDITGMKKDDLAFFSIATKPDGKPRVRTFTDYRVKQYIVSGSEILSGPNDWAGKYIPIIPAVGAEIPVDETTVRHGLVRWAKDPQRLYNYYRSSQAELIGQQPRSPWLVTPKMIAGNEGKWATANTAPAPYLMYTPDPNAPGAKPERMAPPVASPALWQEGSLASDDMKATTGIYDASLGAKSNETSGRAIMARQREGDVGSYHFFDNFKMAIKRAGEVLIDLIPRIYDTERVVRIIGSEAEDPKYVRVNQQTAFETLNDLSVGRFDVRVTAGPSFTTRREEAREMMVSLLQANPKLFEVAGDLFIKAIDAPYAQEISERIRRMMPPQLTMSETEYEEFLATQQQAQPDPAQEAMMQKAMAEIAKTNAEAADKAASAQGKDLDNAAKAMTFGVPIQFQNSAP